MHHNLPNTIKSSKNIQPMFSITDGGAGPPENNAQSTRLSASASIDDYNRVMLRYTQSQMAGSLDMDEANDSGASSAATSQSSAGKRDTLSGSNSPAAGSSAPIKQHDFAVSSKYPRGGY